MFCLISPISTWFGVSSAIAAESDSLFNAANKKFKKNAAQKKSASDIPAWQAGDTIFEAGDDAPIMKLRSVVIEGATVFSSEALSIHYEKYLGNEISEKDLAAIASALTRHYKDAGYALSRAYVLPQDVSDGGITISVVEGYVSHAKIEDKPADYFGTGKLLRPLLKERPLTLKTLERQLMLISDTPGLEIKDTALKEIEPGSGAFELTIFAETWDVWSSGEIDNRGTEDIGPYQTYRSVFFNSLFNAGETIGFHYSSIADTLEELKYGQITGELPLDGRGTRLTGYFSYGSTKPSGLFEEFDTEFTSMSGALNLQFPLIRQRALTLVIGGGIWFSEREEEVNLGVVSEDKQRGIDLFGRLNLVHETGGQTYLYANFRRGLDIADASTNGDPLNSRFDADGTFNRFTLDAVHIQPLGEKWALQLSGAVQLADDQLLSSQEFYFGGARFGRAFESGSLNGDSAVAASAELQYFHNVDHKYLHSLQFYGFADIGTIIEDEAIDLNGATLSSAGFGVRAFFPYSIDAQLELAFPLEDEVLVEKTDNVELFFRVGHSIKLDKLNPFRSAY